MKITKNQLQRIIREEYVKVVFESQGRNLTASQAKIIAENLNEGFFDDIMKSFKSLGKESSDQQGKNEAAVVKTEEQLKKEIMMIQQKAKDMLESNGFEGDDNDVAVLGIDLFRAAVEEVMSASKIAGPVKSAGKRGIGSGRYSPLGRMAR